MDAKRLITIALLLLVGALSAQNRMQVNKLKREVNRLAGSKEFKTASIGFCLMDVETGKVLVDVNAEKSLIPASTIKVITTGAGLALLGDTFRFKTTLSYVGNIINGKLNGDLNIAGFGDPTLGSDRWPGTHIDSVCAVFVKAIKDLGITKINGDIGVFNQTKYFKDNTPPGYEIGDVPTYYGTPLYDINYRENHFTFGYDTIVIPDLYDPTFTRDTIVEKKYSAYRPDGTANPYKPANLFIAALKDNLQRAGVEFVYEDYDSSYNGIFTDIATYYSKPLTEVATFTNQKSINLYAEGILRALDTHFGETVLDTSLAIAQRFWKNEVGSLQGLRMTDGSGLSRSNLCTPHLFCKMLTAYTKRSNFGSFYTTLPVVGKDGTVANFAKGTAAEGNARLKSGSMSRVKCYTGYITGKNGKLYAVAIMFNNFEAEASPTAAAAKIVGKVAELKGGKPKTFVVNRGVK